MARETKNQRKERELKEFEEAQALYDAYLLTVPRRLKNAEILAKSLGLEVKIELWENSPKIYFYKNNIDLIDDGLTYQAEEWQLNWLEEQLESIRKEAEFKKSQMSRAQEIFSTLSKEDQEAIKENIRYCR